jgi:hypothetical protein
MNRNEEKKLLWKAAQVRALRGTINSLDAVLRGYKRVGPQGDVIQLGVSDKRGRWSAYVDLPTSFLGDELIPILKRMRAAAAAELKSI